MSNLPLYHRIYILLRDRILNGEYDWQQPLPGETTLAAQLQVSRATIRRAIEQLEENKLVERRQGARTYASPLAYNAAQRRRNLDLVSSKRDYRELFAGDIDQYFEQVVPDKTLTRQFPGQSLLGRIVRVRASKSKPYCVVVTYMPLEIADSIDWQNLGSRPVIEAVVAAGRDFVKTNQVITATVADEETASALALPIGAPVLRVSGLFLDAADVAVMRKDGYFRPESFEYRTTLYK